VPELVDLLGSDDPAMRAAAASSLADIGPAADDAVPELMRMVRDGDADVRKAAEAALARIQPDSAPHKAAAP
jgi:HEAT repeat protein